MKAVILSCIINLAVTIPQKKKGKKAKWLPEEALQVAEKGREAKGKEEWERYTQLKAEFKKRAKRDKKAFLSEPCKEIEENNRMGQTRDLLKNIGDTKGTFHAKMGTIKAGNSEDLTETEKNKTGCQEYTELYNKGLNDPDNHDGVVTYLEPDILEGEVKWALGRTAVNKASGDDGIPGELFKILKDDTVKGLHSTLENSAMAAGLEKVCFHSNPKEGQWQKMFKLPYICTHFTC